MGWALRLVLLVLMGSGSASARPAPRTGLLFLPIRATGIARSLSERVIPTIQKHLAHWGVASVKEVPALRLATTLTLGADAQLRLVAELLPIAKGTPIFRKAYRGSEALFDRLMLRVVDDLALHLDGRATPASRRLLAVQDMGHGVSEIVMTDGGGTHITPLTRHRSRTQSPTAIRKGRFAYVSYVSGQPEIWGMDLHQRQPKRLYAPSHPGLPAQPALSPDGRTLAFLESDKRGRQSIRLLDWDSGSIQNLTGFSDNLEAPAWSPDGQQLACVETRGAQEVLLILTRGTQAPHRFRLEGARLHGPVWNPANNHITFVATTPDGVSQLRSLQPATGASEVIYAGPGPLTTPRWSPEGPWLAYSSGNSLHLLNTETNATQLLLGERGNFHTPRWEW